MQSIYFGTGFLIVRLNCEDFCFAIELTTIGMFPRSVYYSTTETTVLQYYSVLQKKILSRIGLSFL